MYSCDRKVGIQHLSVIRLKRAVSSLFDLYVLGQPQTKVYIYEDHIKAALSDNIASQAFKESSVFGMLCMIHYIFIG